MKKYYRTLSIAGSDPSGGAGIQADLKTFSACGCFGMTAITAVVDENTVGVYGVHPIPLDFVEGQIRSVLDDIGADAIKIGMLHSSQLIMLVKRVLSDYKVRNIVLDPVMVATSGDSLLEKDAINILKNELIPNVLIITPNIPEAEILCSKKITNTNEMIDAAVELSQNRQVSVMLKAGHLMNDKLIDIFYNAENDTIMRLESNRIVTKNTHGTGCTLSSAITAYLAKGETIENAVRYAKNYINSAIKSGSEYEIGKGHGPVNHFFNPEPI